eukprot:4946861-Prymnesium_polylepis.1
MSGGTASKFVSKLGRVRCTRARHTTRAANAMTAEAVRGRLCVSIRRCKEAAHVAGQLHEGPRKC